MADGTEIGWTDATWNPIRGCTRESQGCRECYAEGIAARFSGPGMPFEGFADRTRSGSKWTGKLALVPAALPQPARWRTPRRIFVNSMSDLFHPNLPLAALDQVFDVMEEVDRHTYQVLTKRPSWMREYVLARWKGRLRPPPHIHLGTSIENQDTAAERLPHLVATPAAVRFVSAEPLLSPLYLDAVKLPVGLTLDALTGEYHFPQIGLAEAVRRLATVPTPIRQRVDWVIAGGESGPRARPAHPNWFRTLRDQCGVARVPFFFKQWGAWAPEGDGSRGQAVLHADGIIMRRVGARRAGNVLDGQQHEAFP